LDVGCGTGALCNSLSKKGLEVTGIDASEKMISIARKKSAENKITFVQASVLEGLPFDDKSFDLSISSYVLHGMKEADRRKVYEEMTRISKHRVIFHDYNQKRALHTDIVERLEGGDYFHFIQYAKAEMANSFKQIQVINVDLHAAWYICTPNDN
jgi:ubiquinone/menaquinone biosynthesis C-methylase UbiE